MLAETDWDSRDTHDNSSLVDWLNHYFREKVIFYSFQMLWKQIADWPSKSYTIKKSYLKS